MEEEILNSVRFIRIGEMSDMKIASFMFSNGGAVEWTSAPLIFKSLFLCMSMISFYIFLALFFRLFFCVDIFFLAGGSEYDIFIMYFAVDKSIVDIIFSLSTLSAMNIDMLNSENDN